MTDRIRKALTPHTPRERATVACAAGALAAALVAARLNPTLDAAADLGLGIAILAALYLALNALMGPVAGRPPSQGDARVPASKALLWAGIAVLALSAALFAYALAVRVTDGAVGL